MDELIEKLKNVCDEMELITELTEKWKDNKVVAQLLFNKKLEDGIIAKLSNASIQQLTAMKNGYHFQYYSKDITDKIIDDQILKNTRRNKLIKINNG